MSTLIYGWFALRGMLKTSVVALCESSQVTCHHSLPRLSLNVFTVLVTNLCNFALVYADRKSVV